VTSPGDRVLVNVSGLNVFYGKSQVVFDLDLTIEKGEVVTLLGRNGAGKTSTLLGIAGVTAARVWAMSVDGQDLSHLPTHKRVRAGVSMVPSGSRAFPNLTVEENLAMVRGAANGKGWTVKDVYSFFPVLAELKHSAGGQLSGGERQMLAIGRAMLARPKVLMLDEPSEGLGPKIVAQLGEMLRELAGEGLAVLLTEQNHRLALATADRAYFIEKGRIVWTGQATEVREGDLVHRYLAV
jgi:branched-chain amino acid transport system ATP-binding protein